MEGEKNASFRDSTSDTTCMRACTPITGSFCLQMNYTVCGFYSVCDEKTKYNNATNGKGGERESNTLNLTHVYSVT